VAGQFNRMIETLSIAREAMREQIETMSRSGFADHGELVQVLRINRDLAGHVQVLLGLMAEEGAGGEQLAAAKDLEAYFKVSDRLLTTMLETARLEFIAENGVGAGVRLRKA
jgi:hypothetical protein